MKRALPVLAAVALLSAGCGGSKTAATTGTTTVPPPARAATTSLELFFLADDGKLVADRRGVPATQAVATAALHELASAPAGTTTQVPEGLAVSIANGDAHVSGGTLSKTALAQIIYTLTEFSSVKTVNGETRPDVEEFVPAILAEHPAPDEEVTSPLHVTGSADTFEATFQYELKDSGGTVIAHGFTTATTGNGMRGTFAFTIPFAVDHAQEGTLLVYESSAENGLRIHVREIPLRLSPR